MGQDVGDQDKSHQSDQKPDKFSDANTGCEGRFCEGGCYENAPFDLEGAIDQASCLHYLHAVILHIIGKATLIEIKENIIGVQEQGPHYHSFYDGIL